MLAVFAQPVSDSCLLVWIFLLNDLLGEDALLLLHIQELVLQPKEAFSALVFLLHLVFDFFDDAELVDGFRFGHVLLIVLFIDEVTPMPIAFSCPWVEVLQH